MEIIEMPKLTHDEELSGDIDLEETPKEEATIPAEDDKEETKVEPDGEKQELEEPKDEGASIQTQLSETVKEVVAKNQVLAGRVEALEAELEASKIDKRKAEDLQFLESLKRDGKLRPADEANVIRLFEILDVNELITYKESDGNGGEVEMQSTAHGLFKDFLEQLPKVVDFEERAGGTPPIAPGSGIEFTTDEQGKMEVVGKELVAQVLKYMEDHPQKQDGSRMDYESALIEVSRQVAQ